MGFAGVGKNKTGILNSLFLGHAVGGFFILTDYFSLSEEEERAHRQELLRLKAEQGLTDGQFYHYDTPLTVAHETEALLATGFATVEVLGQWGATVTLRAGRDT